jgi:hypothetical protein
MARIEIRSSARKFSGLQHILKPTFKKGLSTLRNRLESYPEYFSDFVEFLQNEINLQWNMQ